MPRAFFALGTILSWSLASLVLRRVIESWPLGMAGVMSRVVTLTLLAALVMVAGGGANGFRLRGRGKPVLAMGGIAIVNNVAWFLALKWTSATDVALLFRLDLVFVLLIGVASGLEKVRWRVLPLIGTMFVGLALFIGVGSSIGKDRFIGDALAIGGALGLAANAFVIRQGILVGDSSKNVSKNERSIGLTGPTAAFYNMAFSTLGFLGMVVAERSFTPITFEGKETVDWMWVGVLGVLLAIYLPFYYAALRRFPIWKLRTILLTLPIVVAILEIPIWQLHLEPVQIAGGAIVLVGLAILVQMERTDQNTGGDPATSI